MITKPVKIGVLGIGNVLLRDEGIGVHVARALQSLPSPENIVLEVVDGGTLPGAPFALEDVDRLIIVDAVQAGGKPGSIYRFCPADVTTEERSLTSLHQMDLLKDLWLMERFGQRPRDVVIIGIEPADMELGLELSPTVQARLPQLIDVVLKEIESDHTQPEKGVER